MKELAPYDFVTRSDFPNKKPEAFHDKLNKNRYDIAFDVAWTTETATALNPCTDPSQPKNIFGKDGEYAGYNNRWLMVDNRLAISPFTVKSAVANGYANIMGGCLRVMDNQKISKHSEVKKGVYPYNGVWKRYRVARDGSSKPGVVLDRIDQPDGRRYYKIQPVKEYYLDRPLPGVRKWQRGDIAFVTALQDRGNKPSLITSFTDKRVTQEDIEVEYQGLCDYDIYSKRRHHEYRFVKRLPGSVEGTLRKEQFTTCDDLEKIIYAGSYRNEGKPWFQDLRAIGKTDFVYYETFNEVLANIGKNFLFKALFYHPDALAEGSGACQDKNCLCPRCALFGMTGTTEKENEAVGFRGRFKAAALVCNDPVKEDKAQDDKTVPVKEKKEGEDVIVSKDAGFLSWRHNGEENSRQFLLPILGPPKPNKRDVNGYFNPKTGLVKGAKRYRHARMFFEDLKELIQNTDRGAETQISEYAHHLRPCAQVCKEGLVFTGVLGAENCAIDEIAALTAILDTPTMGHAFKVGLGKALGMGSVRSSIRRIWVRRPDAAYCWETLAVNENPVATLREILSEIHRSEFHKAVLTLKDVQEKLNLLGEGWRERTLRFPTAGLYYWNDFNNPSGPRAGKDTKGGPKGGGGQHKQWQDKHSGGTGGHFSNTKRIKPSKQGK